MSTSTEAIAELANRKYAAGFVTDIDQELFRLGWMSRSFVSFRPRRKSPNGCSITA